MDGAAASETEDTRTPIESLGVLAATEVELRPDLLHLEIYSTSGLLALHWHGPRDARDVVLMCGGAMGGVLGPAFGLYVALADHLATLGIGTIRVGYRVPNDLDQCVHDLAAAADLAVRSGADRFVTVGHSFGGAVALRAGIAFGSHCAGMVLLATQSAGCEHGDQRGDIPLLMLHGTNDRILPLQASQMVQMIAGGELVPLPGAGHLLDEAADELRERLTAWIPARFEGEQPR